MSRHLPRTRLPFVIEVIPLPRARTRRGCKHQQPVPGWRTFTFQYSWNFSKIVSVSSRGCAALRDADASIAIPSSHTTSAAFQLATRTNRTSPWILIDFPLAIYRANIVSSDRSFLRDPSLSYLERLNCIFSTLKQIRIFVHFRKSKLFFDSLTRWFSIFLKSGEHFWLCEKFTERQN